jgi:hypothetical protein
MSEVRRQDRMNPSKNTPAKAYRELAGKSPEERGLLGLGEIAAQEREQLALLFVEVEENLVLEGMGFTAYLGAIEAAKRVLELVE